MKEPNSELIEAYGLCQYWYNQIRVAEYSDQTKIDEIEKRWKDSQVHLAKMQAKYEDKPYYDIMRNL